MTLRRGLIFHLLMILPLVGFYTLWHLVHLPRTIFEWLGYLGTMLCWWLTSSIIILEIPLKRLGVKFGYFILVLWVLSFIFVTFYYSLNLIVKALSVVIGGVLVGVIVNYGRILGAELWGRLKSLMRGL